MKLLCRLRIAVWPALVLSLAACERAAVEPETRVWHQQQFVFDLHIDSPMVARAMRYDLGRRHAAPLGFMPWMLQFDLPRAREGGLDAALFGLVVSPFEPDPVAAVERQLDWVEANLLQRYPEQIVLAHELEDFDRAAAEGRLAIRFALEGAHGLGEVLDPALLDRWHARGVRSLGFAHFHSNAFAASSADLGLAPEAAGLSEAGRRLVCELNLRGWAIDVAHVHPVALAEILAETRAPVIVSHTGIDRHRASFRNLDDDQLRALADNGAVIGIIFAGVWLRWPGIATLDDLADQIELVRDLVGVEHLALGSDYDGFIWTPRGMRDVADLPVLTQRLRDRGWSDTDLQALMGANVRRVLAEIETAGAQMRAEEKPCTKVLDF